MLRYDQAVDLRLLLAHLHDQLRVEAVSCEGGPTVLRELLAESLVDDLFLTHNPVLAGDGERGLIRGSLASPVPAELVWALEAEGELFTRWRISGSVPETEHLLGSADGLQPQPRGRRAA